MKAAVLYEVNKPLVIEDISLPKPGPRAFTTFCGPRVGTASRNEPVWML